jgi:hypothetical protein
MQFDPNLMLENPKMQINCRESKLIIVEDPNPYIYLICMTFKKLS